MTKKIKQDTWVKQAYRLAKEARKKAYAPYSKYYVGSTLVMKKGKVFVSGCNVENASYGATICAERNAIFSAVATHGKKCAIEGFVLVTESVAVPCGLCLQVMAEFCDSNIPIYLADKKGIKKMLRLKELLPKTFGPKNLS